MQCYCLYMLLPVCVNVHVWVLLYTVLLLVNINTAPVYIIRYCDYTILLLLYVAASAHQCVCVCVELYLILLLAIAATAVV